MINRAFRYDLLTDKWIEIEDKNFIDTDIEKLPSVLVLKYFCLENHVYCPQHHFLEMIVSENDSEIISDEGCKFKDSDRVRDKNFLYCPIHKQLEEIILIDGNEIITDTFCKFNSLIGFGLYMKRQIPFRWRIFQRTPESPINIAVDFAIIQRDNSGIRRRWENFYINVSMQKKISIIKKVERKNWTDNPEMPIPENVMEIALEVLRESTKAVYGIKPTVITKFQGLKKIFAYLERPFDVIAKTITK